MSTGHGSPAVPSDSYASQARHRVASPSESGRCTPSPATARSSGLHGSKQHRAFTRVRSSRRFWVYLLVLVGAVLLLVPGYLYLHTTLLHRSAIREGAKGAAGEGGRRKRPITVEETRIHDGSWAQFSTRRRHELSARAAQGETEGSGSGSLGSGATVAAAIAGLGAELPQHAHYVARAKAGPFPIKLRYPVLWGGALFSKSGYGTEAVSYMASLLQLGLVAPEDIWISQAGDHMHEEVLNTMDPGLLKLLRDHHYHNMTAHLPPDQANRPVIAVCHTFPDCWRTPADDDPRLTVGKALKGVQDFVKYKVLRRTWRDDGCPCPHADIQDQVVYRIGRSMFETEHVPGPVAAYTQFVDEVWVPSEFNRLSFAASGVDLPKLHTLAQGINTTLFSPLLQPPLDDLAQLHGTVVAGRPALTPYTSAISATTSTSASSQQQQQVGGSGSQQPERSHRRGVHSGRDVLDAMFNVQPDLGDGEGKGRWHSGPFRFLSVFKWEMRKGWDILLRAYMDEFRGEPDVELHILTKPFFEKVNDFPSYFRRVVGPLLNVTRTSDWDELPRVVLYNQHVPEALYPRVYSSMDTLVIPTRGEGWGRPQIEAMAMGLPVISTNWSGLTAFMDDKVAYPIRVDGVVPVQDSGPNSFEWFQGQRWAQPDVRHLRQLMRGVFTERQAAAKKGAAGRAKVLREFSESVVAHQLLAQILRVQDVVDQLLWGQLQVQSPPAGTQQQQRTHAPVLAGGGSSGGTSLLWGDRGRQGGTGPGTSLDKRRRQNRQLQGDSKLVGAGKKQEEDRLRQAGTPAPAPSPQSVTSSPGALGLSGVARVSLYTQRVQVLAQGLLAQVHTPWWDSSRSHRVRPAEQERVRA